MYQNFILELEWRHLVPKGNAGVFVWADDITARGQPFHRGIEIQVLENAYGNTKHYSTHGDIFPIHGATMKPANGRGGQRSFPTELLSKPSPEWNHYRIECNEGTVTLSVNGKMVNQGSECSPSKGYICLESEGGVVHYRNVKVKELPDTPVDDADVAIADRGYSSIYSGVDLNGWIIPSQSESWFSRDWNLVHEGKGEGTIQSAAEYGDFGFVVDVVRLPESKMIAFSLRGEAGVKIVVSPENEAVENALVKPGKWNRFEGKFEGDQLTLRLNGELVYYAEVFANSSRKGPLLLHSSGKVEWANIYIKEY